MNMKGIELSKLESRNIGSYRILKRTMRFLGIGVAQVSIRTRTHYAAKQACKQRPDKPVAILLDTKAFKLTWIVWHRKKLSIASSACQGPEIRTGFFKDGPYPARGMNLLLLCSQAWIDNWSHRFTLELGQDELAGGKINLKEGQELKLVTDYTFKVHAFESTWKVWFRNAIWGCVKVFAWWFNDYMSWIYHT